MRKPRAGHWLSGPVPLALALPEFTESDAGIVAALLVHVLVRRRGTCALSLFGRGALALHRREAPFAPWGYVPAGQPTQGTTEIYAAAGTRKQLALLVVRSHIPKIGARSPVTLRNSDH